METKDTNALSRRNQRNRAERLTVDLPAGTLTALKIHAAQRETTIREVVTDLIQNKITSKGAQA